MPSSNHHEFSEFQDPIVIHITAESTAGTVRQIQHALGGTIEERWGEHVLTINNEKAFGNIRFITLDWGVSLLEYDIKFAQNVVLEMDTSEYNPIHFTYTLAGYCGHRFGYQNEIKRLEQFQSVIITSKDGGFNYGYFPKNVKLEINLIQITRRLYLKKRLNNVSQLHKKLYEVFMDSDHENAFAYYGTYNLKMATKIGALRKVKSKGMTRILQIESMMYQILSAHINQFDSAMNNKRLPTNLLKSELRLVRKMGNDIAKNPSFDYSLDAMSEKYGLAQAKLQEGCKLLYSRTVTEYIRHVRLEQARDLIANTELNISEVVYSIGFSSRSYFSKIFKEKYQISPSDFKSLTQEDIKEFSNTP